MEQKQDEVIPRPVERTISIRRQAGGVTYTQGFDAENRLISVNVTGQALPTLFIYDGDGNLIMQRKPDGSRTLSPSTTPRKAAAPLRAEVGGDR